MRAKIHKTHLFFSSDLDDLHRLSSDLDDLHRLTNEIQHIGVRVLEMLELKGVSLDVGQMAAVDPLAQLLKGSTQ